MKQFNSSQPNLTGTKILRDRKWIDDTTDTTLNNTDSKKHSKDP